MNAAIGVVVVSHFSEETIEDCLRRLLAAEDVAAVVVVDNGSRDDTLPILRRLASRDPRLRFIANPHNPGFAVACNQGAARLDAPWLAFVNPDLLVEPDTLARLRRLAEDAADAGLLGADLVDEGGERDVSARRSDPSFRAMLAGFGRRGSVAVPANDALDLQAVDAVSGALMLLPRGLFLQLDGFDEGYRLHAEDLDLCRRVRQAGHAVFVANGVRVVHIRGVSSRRRPAWVEWQKHRGMWRYFRKFEGAGAGFIVRGFVFAAVWAHFLLAAPRAWLAARRQPS